MDINRAIAAVEGHVEDGPSVSRASDLSAQERIFCDVFVGNGGKAGEAARAAGYADASADVTACKLLCRPRVAARIKALCETFTHSTLPVAIAALVRVISDPKALNKDVIKAANSLVELAGMTAPKGGVHVNVGVQVNGGQAQQLIQSVWDAKQRRLSDIPPAMTDRIDEVEANVRQLEADDPAPAGGGISLRVPVAESRPIPPPSDAKVSKPGDLPEAFR